MLLNLREAGGPLYRRVYLALKAKIRAGGLGPAARVPSTRALARRPRRVAQHGDAGLRAARRGGIPGEPRPRRDLRGGRGAATARLRRPLVPRRPVRRASPPTRGASPRGSTPHALRPPGPRAVLRYDFRYGRPAVDEFPREIWRRLLAAHARRASADALGYGSPAGHAPAARGAQPSISAARAASCATPISIVIVNGSQQALDLAARVLLDPGDGAVVEEPHYPGATVAVRGGRRPPHPRAGATRAGSIRRGSRPPRRARGWPT